MISGPPEKISKSMIEVYTMTAYRLENFVALGNSGGEEDVDVLMKELIENDDLTTIKLVDYALSLVTTRPGSARIRHYLFNGQARQRNYAALYFKRRGNTTLLEEAFGQGKIDSLQAYAS